MFTVLLYHGIDSGEAWDRPLDAIDREYILRRATFEEHVTYIAKAAIPVSSLDACVAGRAPDQHRIAPVVLTFDDGDLSGYTTAAPLLEAQGFRAEFFVVTDWVNRPGFMTEDQLRELVRRGHGVHSHSQTHAVLSSVDAAQIEFEVAGSKAALESMLGREVSYFSIPGGAYDQRVIAAAHRAGYRAVLNSVEGYNDERSFLLQRFTARAYTGAGSLGTVCRRPRYTQARLAVKRRVLSIARRMMGADRYGRIRNAVVSSRRRL
jgi:peptidoglycan/xylan/chitin deacetylase (PgdA/CDA1 family)